MRSADIWEPDVSVFGAGVFGLAVAWACVRRGARVQVIDPNGVGAGASGGIVGALAPHTPENWNQKKQFQFESLIMAQGYWDEVSRVSGVAAGYRRSGRLQPLFDAQACALARARAEGAGALWQGQAEWRLERAEAFGEWAPESGTGWVIHDTLSARIHPLRACQALAGAIVQRGGRIVTGSDRDVGQNPVQGALRGRRGLGQVVQATGYQGLEAMNAQHPRQVGNGVKGQAVLLRFEAGQAPQIYADGVHIVPHGDGTVAIGSTSERFYQAPASTDALLDAVHARAVAAVPVLRGAEIIRRWAAVRPRARSRAPMLGRHPFEPECFIANGGFKIGFGVAPKVGEVMADLLLEGRDQIPPDFAPEVSLTAGQAKA